MIISELKDSMPSMFGKDSKRKQLLDVKQTIFFFYQTKNERIFLFRLKNLHVIYEKIEREQNIPIGDFPKIDRMQEILRNMVIIIVLLIFVFIVFE